MIEYLDEVAAGLTGITGRDWSASAKGEDRSWPYLTDGATEISAYESQGRLVVSGRYPQNNLYQVARHEATVAVSRGPEVAAQEIARRVLPGVAAETERVRQSNADDIAKQATVDALTGRLAQLLGVTPRPPETHRRGVQDRHMYTRSSLPGGGYLAGDFRVSSYEGGSVTIELRACPPALALEIARVIGACSANEGVKKWH